jgi:hypothetical protein
MTEHSHYTNSLSEHRRSIGDNRWPPLVWTAFVLLPIDGWGFLDGLPLGWFDAAVVFAVWLVWARQRRLAGKWIIGAALVLKIAAAPFLIEHGFSASYFANETFAPPLEQSVEYRGGDATRVDQTLSFGREGVPDLPLFFFDDFRRFNFYQRGEPRRYELPFSVIWDGYAWVEEGERARTFHLRGSALKASLEIDGAPVLELSPGSGSASTTLLYPKGWRHIVVRVAAAPGAARDFEAGSADRPFGSEAIYRVPASRAAMLIDRVVRLMSRGIDLAVLGLLAWSALAAARRPSWASVAAIVAMGEALWFAAPATGRLILQPGGDDSLTYQTYARDIVMNGPLMLLGAPAGQAEPFYYQPLYSYFLAFVHLLFGDDLSGLYLLQRLSLAIVAGCTWWIARTLYGRRAGRSAIIIGILFLYGWVDPWARTLWTEVLFVLLTSVWTCLLIRLATPDAGRQAAIVAGIVGGAAVLTRSTLLLAFAVVPPLLIIGRRRIRGSTSPVFVMVMIAAAVISLATLRNWIASGHKVPITTSFGINLYLGNAPPVRLPVHADHEIYRWVSADENTRQVIEYGWHEPGGVAANLRNKTLYAFGYFEPLVAAAGFSPVLILTWIAAIIGAAVALKTPPPAPLAPFARFIPAAISSSLFASVILIFPSHFRLILPGYVLLLPYVAALAARPWRRA